MPAPDAYKLLAKYYDRLFPVQSAWFDRIRAEILDSILPEIDSVCDLACGTGRTALMFARQGIRVFALDMRCFSLPEPVDLVTCEFDALNHVGRRSDLARVAKCVYRALRPGGHFYCDVNNRVAFEELQRNTRFFELPGVAVVKHGGFDCGGVPRIRNLLSGAKAGKLICYFVVTDGSVCPTPPIPHPRAWTPAQDERVLAIAL